MIKGMDEVSKDSEKHLSNNILKELPPNQSSHSRDLAKNLVKLSKVP